MEIRWSPSISESKERKITERRVQDRLCERDGFQWLSGANPKMIHCDELAEAEGRATDNSGSQTCQNNPAKINVYI